MGEFSVAPMLDVTDRHCRAFLRRLSPRVTLYTEMRVANAVLHGERERMLGYDPSEHPVILQLAGAEPAALAAAARLAECAGYDEVNLNIGCPSTRGPFGACQMKRPTLVAECVAAMGAAVSIPITVKTRIGVDHHDSDPALDAFISEVARAGCRHFIMHARKAWLKGLNPKQNREVPPLRYERVYRLKRDFPALRFTLNGGITTVGQAQTHLRHVDGVMIGREVRRDPWLLCAVETAMGGAPPPVSRAAVVAAHLPYIERQLQRGVHLRHMIRPMLGLFRGQPGARRWRRQLCEQAARRGAGIEVVEAALEAVTAEGEGDSHPHPYSPREKILAPPLPA